MNWRRDRGFLDIEVFALTSAEVISATGGYADAEIIYGEELSHSGRRFSKTIFFGMAEIIPILGRHSELATSSGPELNHDDRSYESRGENRAVRQAVMGREFVIGFWWGNVGNPSNRATDAPRAKAGSRV
jgi:hypothetical protein